MAAIALGNALELWRVPITEPVLRGVVLLALAISVTPIYLVTWRLARRFGWRGWQFSLASWRSSATKDYLFASTFPGWMVFAPGVAPILADAVTYVGIVALGHAVMRLVAGPSRRTVYAMNLDRLGAVAARKQGLNSWMRLSRLTCGKSKPHSCGLPAGLLGQPF